jgi:hypothetical protein
MSLVFSLITLQALLGGLDNFWHHEITERLPARRTAAGSPACNDAAYPGARSSDLVVACAADDHCLPLNPGMCLAHLL